MATSKGRLDKIAESLTPKQAVIAWMEEAHSKFATKEEYLAWLGKHPEEPLPLERLTEQVETAIRKRMKGEPPDKLQTEVRRAKHEAVFLFCLQENVNLSFQCEARSLGLLCVVAAEPVRNALRDQRSRRTRPSAGDDPFRAWQTYVFEVRGHQGVVDQIAKQYFDGHPVLWKSLAEHLEMLGQSLHEIDDAWKCVDLGESLRESRCRSGNDGHAGEKRESRNHPNLKTVDERFTFTYSEPIIEGAKADAHAVLGETQTAIDLKRKIWLRASQGVTVEHLIGRFTPSRGSRTIGT